MDYKLLAMFMGCMFIIGCGSDKNIDADTEIEYEYQAQAVKPYGHEYIAEQNRHRSSLASHTEPPKTVSAAPIARHSVAQPPTRPMTKIQLDMPIKLNFLSEDTTFRESIDGIRNSVPGGLNVVVLWRDLERVGIEEDTPLRMDPISSTSLKTALKLILESVSGGYDMINYKITDNIIVIATNETLARFEAETRIYDITDLAQLPAEYRIQRSDNTSRTSDISGISNR